ncbi:MAG: fasciclin domain-containing protein [Trueperaceae bacterium]|nr:fasciclin domain-containing protein [Trueperaceae bacterium]
MRFTRTLFAGLTVLALGVGSAQTIVDIAVADKQFSTLVTAVTAAGLVETLAGEGPFTVFAPTNDAFVALPAGALDAVLADPELLTAVLTYHVVAGDVRAADVVALTNARTLQGEHVQIGTEGGVTIDGANVVAAAGGVSGSVLIVDMGRGDTHVYIDLAGTPTGGNHPVRFHAGRCDAPGGVVIPLANVDGDTGRSSTRLDVPFEWIVGGTHYVNMHLSPDQMGVSVACGDVGLD